MDTRFAAGGGPAVDLSADRLRERRHSATTRCLLSSRMATACWLWDEHGRRHDERVLGRERPRTAHRSRAGRASLRLAVTSRVFHNELLPRFLERLHLGGPRSRAAGKRRRRVVRRRSKPCANGAQGQRHPLIVPK
jgi:hypothetical protein